MRRLRGLVSHALLRFLAGILRRLSWSTAQRCGRVLGELLWHLGRRDRRRALAHLALAFPERPVSERRALARASFRHLGTCLAEYLHLSDKSCREVLARVTIDGFETVEALCAAGRPVLIVSGHCGNWELLGAALNCRGLGMATIARSLDEPRLQRLLVGLRRRFGTDTIARGSRGASRQLLRLFKEGRALAIFIDQDTRVEGVWVPFFGRPAFTPVGAAKIAARQGAAVVPAFIERVGDGSHRLTLHPPLPLPDDPEAATAAMTAAIEAQVRRRPEQWVWLHRRWRRRPPAAPPPGPQRSIPGREEASEGRSR